MVNYTTRYRHVLHVASLFVLPCLSGFTKIAYLATILIPSPSTPIHLFGW